nr:protein ELYS isoform X1 [Nothobranchius furzeri]
MRELTAQVTSSLLPFSGVTVDALGEDDISLDCVLQGKFTLGRSGLAWLACGPHLEVVHAVTGERLSAYCFSGGGENPPRVLAARDFSWLKRSGLLVGLEESEGSVLCLYDLGLSRVVKAVVIPGRITAIEPLVSYGGASTSTQHLHQSLRWFFGIAAVVTDLGHVLLVDLCLDDLSCSQSELEASDLQVVTKSPADIPGLREVSTREGRHLCLQLNRPSGVGVTALQYTSRTNLLAVGFSDGHLQLWNMKALKKEYHSQLDGGGVPVHAFTFQEPENDPRNCCYLWAVQSAQDLEGDTVSLHLLQLAFSERKCLASGKILYEGLEYCEERYSQDLSGTTFPLRAQASKTWLLSCQTIEKFRPHPDRDDSMNEVASPDTSLSIFSWQVRSYGQGAPSTFIGVFDINRWYHAQMPDSLRAGESLQNCPYLAVWSLDPVVQMVSPHSLLDVVVHERSLSRGLPFTCPPPEQYFNPTTYNFDATCLLNSGIVHLTCSGHQKETLSFLKKAAPCSSDVISTSYSHCLMSGLLSSRLTDTQASSLSLEEQLDAILSTAVETSSLGLITGCIKQWTAEEQPGSALNLRYILDWAWNKVVQTKEELDGICAPLFDSSSNFTDPQTLQLLQHSQRLLGNLSAIFHCLLSEAQELTQKGLVGLMNKNIVSSLISKYAQVVLWFCRTGLLPEGPDEDALQISRPFYSHSVISNYYTIRREELTRLAKGKWCADCLMIDGLVGQCGDHLVNVWKRDEGGTGQYPPPTLHALLDIYLLENIDEAAKHAIVIYLLLDVMYSFPNKDGASVESFPTAFAIPIGLVKLVQGLWLLDHHDHQSSFELLLHPAASQFYFEWQHERVLQALMCQGQQSVALRYFHVTNPPLASTPQAKLCLSVLLHNRCLIEAWSLLRQHSNHLNIAELLSFFYESCQELGLIKELLKLPLSLNEQECLEKFLQGTGGLQNRELLLVHYLQQANYIPALQLNNSLKLNLVNERDPKLKERSNTRNSILDQYGKVLPRVQRKLAMERSKPYQHPYTTHREVSQPQPLSTITKRSANEKVMTRAGFIHSVLTKVEEVWLGKGATPQPSPVKSRRAVDSQSSSPKTPAQFLPDAFLGTPISIASKRKPRLVDLMVHPSSQSPQLPLRPSSSWISPKSFNKAPELRLLQTPQVVKRARAVAASGPVFSAFTPQSILRSSLRPTPVATPSASPGHSITPPLRSKETRITFTEDTEAPEVEKGNRWTNGVAAESEISQLSRGSTLSKATHKTWSSQPAEEEDGRDEEQLPQVKFLSPDRGVPSSERRCSERNQEVAADAARAHLNLSFDSSQVSIRSTDTTLEFYDAPLSEDHREDSGDDDGVVTINIKRLTETKPEENPGANVEQSLRLPSEDEEKEGEPSEDVMRSDLNREEVESKQEEDLNFISICKQDVATVNQEEPSVDHEAVGNQVTESSEDKSEDVPLKDEGPNVKLEAAGPPELSSQQTKPSEVLETTNDPAGDPNPSADLTEFVHQHLFGGDLSPPLSRSGIHHASLSRTTLNSESVGEADEEDGAPAEDVLVFSTQKSVTSSEPTGTDSHSVVSVNDSEDLSSPASEEEEEDDDEDDDDGDIAEEDSSDQAEVEEGGEEEEDSGSEVEIIEEVQGNGRLPPLLATSAFVEQEHTHFLSEQEVAELSLITAGAQMKMVEDDMEGEVVMVRLGADDDDDDEHINPDPEQGSSYMELKPTTLLVPLELVEGQHSLAHGAPMSLPELQPDETDEPPSNAHSSFTLMLDVDEYGVKEVGMLPIENDPPNQLHTENNEEEVLTKPDVISLATDSTDPSVFAEASQDQKEQMDGNDLGGLREEELVELQNDSWAQDTAATLETEDAGGPKKLQLVMLPEDHESASVPVPAAEEELPAAVDDVDFVEKMVPVDREEREANKPTEEEQKSENGPVGVDTEMETVEAVVEEEEEEQNPKAKADTKAEEKTEQRSSRRTRNKSVEEKSVEPVLIPENQTHKRVPQTPTSQRKSALSAPTRRVTRGRSVSFISTLVEEEEGEKDSQVPVSTSRSLRKSEQVKETTVQLSTPRRSTRKTLPEVPEDEMEAKDRSILVTSASRTSSPARLSQKSAVTRTSKRLLGSSSKKPEGAETEGKEDQQNAVVEKAVSRGSKTPNLSRSRTVEVDTPRRSSRRTTTTSSETAPTPLKMVKEEEEHDVSPTGRNSRRTKSETPTAVEEDRKRHLSSRGRTTRQSGQITLNMFPQVTLVPVSRPQSNRKMKRESVAENIQESDDLLQQERNKNTSQTKSRCTTRSKLWHHPEEDLPLLDSPLEVDSETPVADALIRRLQDEEERQKGGDVTTSATAGRTRSRTKSSQPPVGGAQEEQEFLTDEVSYIYSPSRIRGGAPRAESAAPVTRSRMRGKHPQDKTASDEDHKEVKKARNATKTRGTSRRAVRSRSVPEPLPVAEVDVISPMPSPDPLPQAVKRIKGGEAPTTSRNLRNKRVLDTVFKKPITRRRKL